MVIALNNEILLPENAPVRLTSAQLEELDYTNLYRAYSVRDRKSKVDPRVLFKVMVYGYQCGIYSSRKLEEACRYRVDFMWPLEEYSAPDHATLARFRTGRCAAAAEDLFYQYVALLEKQKGYITFVYGKGSRKSDEQRQWKSPDELRQRWESYEEALRIMGPSRNSCSKTDPDATFMRMKEDHMRNGQLKPAYNVQIAVNSEYIIGVEVFSNRTDFGTLAPFLQQLKHRHGQKYAEVTADAGYKSLENYLYLEENGQFSFIKPANYESKRRKSFQQKIGRIGNMDYDADGDCFICAQGRKPYLRRESTELGIYLRMCRSIQVEGAFALLKTDFGFRRFLTRGKANVRTELFFLSMAFNLKKLWMKRENGRLKTHLSEIRVA